MKKNNSVKYYTQLYVSFSDLFPEEDIPDLQSVLAHYSRQTIINVVLAINNNFGDGKVSNFGIFFSSDNKEQYNEILKRFFKFREHSLHDRTEYYFASFITGLELLRCSFSLPSETIDEYPKETFEWNLFRAILIINEQTICRYQANETVNKYEFLYLNNFCYVEFGKDIETFAFQQYCYAYYFFKFLENTNEKTLSLLSAFQSCYGTTWHKYILSLMAVYTLSLNYKGRLKADLKIDVDHLISKTVLDKISMSPNDIFKYKSDNREDRTGNSDYRFFREFPLIKENGNYILYSSMIILGKIYNGLFFDLQNINRGLPKKERIGDIKNLIQEQFIQNYLLVNFIVEISKRDIIYTEEMMKSHYPQKSNKELGAPDLLLLAHKYCIIFECKDIKFNGWIKEQKDWKVIQQELNAKILGSAEQDHKGIGQLTGHIKNIRNENFHWAKIASGKKIYPVLLLSDPSLIQEGFYGIAKEKYAESLNNKNVRKISANRPLIIMSPITLIKYKELFQKKGFAYYFEKYYSWLNVTHQYEFSFEHFMGFKKFTKDKLIKNILEDIKK